MYRARSSHNPSLNNQPLPPSTKLTNAYTPNPPPSPPLRHPLTRFERWQKPPARRRSCRPLLSVRSCTRARWVAVPLRSRWTAASDWRWLHRKRCPRRACPATRAWWRYRHCTIHHCRRRSCRHTRRTNTCRARLYDTTWCGANGRATTLATSGCERTSLTFFPIVSTSVHTDIILPTIIIV